MIINNSEKIVTIILERPDSTKWDVISSDHMQVRIKYREDGTVLVEIDKKDNG